MDAEADGVASVGADGDNTATGAVVFGTCATAGDDEDGVGLGGALIAGLSTNITVTANAACTLNAWMDFNGDGDWGDAGEQIFAGEALTVGANPLSINVPATAVAGNADSKMTTLLLSANRMSSATA